MLDYDEVIEIYGVKIPFVQDVITPKIEKPIRNNRYERGECEALARLLRPGDRVLELGAGIGLCSTVAALSEGVAHVTAVEANPALIDVIQETHRINDVGPVDLRNAVVTADPLDSVEFYLRPNFWASSMEPDSRPYDKIIDVPALSLDQLLDETRATVVVCDTEGAELDLFDETDLSGVRLLIVEVHPKVYGNEGIAAIDLGLAEQGFVELPAKKPSSVRIYRRSGDATTVVAEPEVTDWPPVDPRILVPTCMRNEGPFILEWLAWHKAVGVTDFVVFSNDCTDGTDRILDRLEELGHLTHHVNPAIAMGRSDFQPTALSQLHHMKLFRRADFVIPMDVDEFINVREGRGKLSDLFAKVGPFDVLSMTELNHGSNGRMSFEPGWVTEQFPGHQTEGPGRWKAQRGVKSITRLSDRVERVRNHRPDVLGGPDEVTWLDGSGRPLATLLDDAEANGIDCRGTYAHVVLDHFPLRSLESFIAKMGRGDVVVPGKQVSNRYWRVRNRADDQTSDLTRIRREARAIYDALLRDPTLAILQDATCEAHRQEIGALWDQPAFKERREWILENAWEGENPA